MKKKIVYGGSSIAIIVLDFALSGLLINAKPIPKKDSTKTNSIYVKAKKVNAVETESSMTYPGRVTAFDNVSLAAEVQGKIIQVDVRFNPDYSSRSESKLLI